MKQRFLSVLTIALSAMIIFPACKKGTKVGLYVPKDAAIVVHFNAAEMNKKLPWAEVKGTEWFKEVIKDTATSAFAKTMLENPENSGVDINNDLLMFVKKDSLGGYVAFEGAVKDETKFKAFNAEVTKSATPEVKDGLTYYSGNKLASYFNKERFVILMDAPDLKKLDGLGEKNIFDTATLAAPAVSNRDLKLTSSNVFNLTKDNSISTNSKFADVMSETGDVHFWISMEQLYSNSWGGAAMSMFNMSKLYKESVYAGIVNFENGKIVANTRNYGNKEVTGLMKQYEGSACDKDMLKRMPSDNMIGAMALNIKPQVIIEFLKLAGLDGMANMGLGMAGLSLEDITKSFKGDIALAVTDVKKDSIMGEEPTFVFAAKVGDKTSFDKVMNALKMMSKGSDKVAMETKDGMFAAGNDKQAIAKYLSSANNNNNPMIDKVGSDPMGGFIDFQKIFSLVGKEKVRDSLQNIQYELSKKMWENIIFTGGNVKSDAARTHFEVNLLDKNTNALKQLNVYLNEMAKIEQERKKMNKGEDVTVGAIAADTVTVVTPVPH